MHLASESVISRLKSDPKIYGHFQKYRAKYVSYSVEVKLICSKYPLMDKPETRVYLISKFIFEEDPAIWGLKSDDFPAKEISDLFARMVDGHDK